MEQLPGNQDTAAPAVPGVREGWLRGKLRSLREQKAAVKADPLWGTVFVAIVAVTGWGANELYGNWKESRRKPDQHLVQIRDTQEREFAALKEGLDALRGSIPSANSDDLKKIQGAISNIETQNLDLLNMLALAGEENVRVRQLAEAKTGVRGGYDLILTENAGMQLDSSTQLGVSDLRTNWVVANITSRQGVQSETLESGESIAYEGAGGQPCRATLLSIRANSAASFAVSCG